MSKTKTTKRALLSSVLAMLLSVTMLIGTTFAWFTDTASTAVNKIQAGNLDIELQYATAWDGSGNPTAWADAEGRTLQFRTADGRTNNILWEPGCTYQLPELRIVNNGDLALKYKVVITGIAGDAKLNEAIDWTMVLDGAAYNMNDQHKLAAKNGTDIDSNILTIKGHMQETAGNEYQGLSIDGIGITVYATQLGDDTLAENDSFGNQYDKDAEYNMKSATIMGDNGETVTLESGKTYTIGNATVEVAANGDITYTNTTGVAQSVTITTDGGKLTVNAPDDTVYHYGEADFVDIAAVAGNSFHEFGKVDVLSITTGRVVIENGDNVLLTQVKSENAVVAVPENKVLETKLAKADGVTEIKLQKGDDELIVIKEEESWNKPEEDIPAELEKVVGTTIAEANDNYVARIGNNNFYETLAAALNAANPGDTVLMLKDFENANLSSTVNFSLKNGVTLDGKGHKIVGNACVHMCTAADATSTVNNVIFENIHNDRVVSQDNCDYYGWKNGKVGMQSAIFASGLQGTANITNCTFNGVDWDAIQVTPKGGSTLNITGNTFMHSDTEFSQLRYIHVEGGSYFTKSTINVNNNSFYKTKHLNDPEPTNIGIWYVSSSYTHLTGNYFEYNPAEQIIDTNSEVPGDTESLFPARSQANVNIDDLEPVYYIGDIAYLSWDVTPPAYYGSTSYPSLQEAINSTSRVYLTKDNYEDVSVPEGKTFTIYTRSSKMNGDITNNGTLVLTSGTNTEGTSTIINNGTLQLGCDAATGYKVTNNGTVKITSGTGYDLSKITNDENGKVIISGGTFTTQPQADWIQFSYKAAVNEDGTYGLVLMTDEEAVAAGAVVRYSSATSTSRKYFKTLDEGLQNGAVHLLKDISGTFTNNARIDLYCGNYTFTGSLMCPGKSIYIDDGTAILDRIECGTFYGGYSSGIANIVVKDGTATKIKVAKNATVVIYGGDYTGAIEVTAGGTGSLTIKGGTFSSDPTDYLPYDYEVREEDGKYVVVPKVTVASDAGELQTALAKGGIVVINKDIEADATKTTAADRITISAPTTLNLDAKFIVPGELEPTANWAGLYISAYTVINATENGGVQCSDKANGECGTYVANITNGANVTINGGTYYGGGTTFQVQQGTLTINGGHFEVTSFGEPHGFNFLLNCVDENYRNGTANIIVKGGTFVNFNPANNSAEGDNTNFVAEGYTVVSKTQSNGDIWYTVVPQ